MTFVEVLTRSIPRSKRNPQFNQDILLESLKRSGIDYVLMRQLGGLRHPTTDSPNVGWRNLSFRGFADYMRMDLACGWGHTRCDPWIEAGCGPSLSKHLAL